MATKLTLTSFGETHEVAVIRAWIKEEHPDNDRFAADCEEWFGRPITTLRDDKFGASTDEVWKRERFLSSRAGAPCTRALKRRVLDAFCQAGDVMVLGYTWEERDRLESFKKSNAEMWEISAPLIDRGLTKADCHAILKREGIAIPMMYRLGYRNNNCIGCVKGGMGYWNKIRVDFPERFNAVADIQDELGPGAYLFRDYRTGERFSLRQLRDDQGRYAAEPDISCGFFCEGVRQEIGSPSRTNGQESGQ